MRRVTLALAAVALVGLAANLAVAREPSHRGAGQASLTLVRHHGHSGSSHGSYGHGSRSYGYSHRYPSHYRSYGHSRGPRTVYPPVWGYPPVPYPPIYRGYGYCYPRSSFGYYGRGFGISIGF
jgi:hypothetical protein